MIYPDSLVEMRADGIGDIMLTPGGVKLSLFQIRPISQDELQKEQADRVEVRQVVGIVSMNVPQLVEGLVTVLGAIASNAAVLDKGRAAEFTRMLAALKNVEIEMVEPPAKA